MVSFFCGHGLVLVNVYIILKTLCDCEEGKVKPTSHYEFWRLDLLAKINTANFGGRDHLVSEVQNLGTREIMSLHLLVLFQHRGR